MEKQTIVRRSHRALIIVGFAAIAIVFLAYAKNNDIAVTPSAISALQRLAAVTYLVLLLAFGAIGWGLYKFYKAKISIPILLGTPFIITRKIRKARNGRCAIGTK